MDLPRLVIVLLGISSVTTQLLTVRELLSQFHGNEITVSLTVFSWLILTGLGAFIGRPLKRASARLLAVFVFAAGAMPLVQVAAIRLLRDLVFVHGTSQGFYPIMLFIAATTAPYCLVSGFLLPLTQAASRLHGSYMESGVLYAYDSVGDIAGGIIFSFFLVYFLTPFQALALTALPLVLTSLVILWRQGAYGVFLLLFATSVLLFASGLRPATERWSLSAQYGEILEYAESPYGRIVVTAEGGQRSVWESGVPLYSSRDTVSAEEKIHYALAQIDGPEAVLLVSGGLGETLEEVRKHGPGIVDYVELDPALTSLGIKHGLIRKGPGINIINTDGRIHLKETATRYDAVIFDLPEPDSFQINRFYTQECLRLVKNVMRPGGVFSVSLDYSANYLSKIERRKLSVLFRTLRDHFSHILIMPGERIFFICRDSELYEDIPSRLALKGIAAPYVEGFFYGNVTKERMERVRSLIDQAAQTNSDFKPMLMKVAFQDWFARYGGSLAIFFTALGAGVLIYPLFIKREEYILYTTGFAMMGAEMVAVFSFQAVFGYLYLQIGAIVSAFLLGLFPGAMAGNSTWAKGKAQRMLLFSDCLIMALLLALLCRMGIFGTLPSPWIFLAYCVIFSGACGFQFPIAAHLLGEERSPAARCLAADLWGAACGTVAAGVLLIPFFGMGFALLALIAVKVSSIIVGYVRRRAQGF